MPEEIIKARIVFDTGNIAGALGEGGAGGLAGSLTGGVSVDTKVKGWVKAFTLPITDVLKMVSRGINKLADASPHLAASLKQFHVGMKMLLIPIGEVISFWLRPFLARFMRWGFKFFQDYQSGGFWEAFKNAMGGLGDLLFGEGSSFWEKLASGLEIAATLLIGKAILGGLLSGGFFKGIATALGIKGLTGGKGGLLIAAVIVLGALKIGEALGFDSFESALLAFIALGSYVVAGAGIAIPLTITFAGLIWGTKKLMDYISEHLESLGMTAKYGDSGITAEMYIDLIFRRKKQEDRASEREFLEGQEDVGVTKESIIAEGGTGFTPGGMISMATKEDAKTMRKHIEESKGMWDDFVGWLGDIFTTDKIAEVPPTGFGTAISDDFKQSMPLMATDARKNFVTDKGSFIEGSIKPSITKVKELYSDISSLNRTVTTTHIIKTVHVTEGD